MAITYYLKIDGVSGDSTNNTFLKWIQVDSFSFGESTPFSRGAGVATGRSQFTPLTVDIHSLAGLTTLFSDEATQKLIKSVELVGVDTSDKGTAQTVLDIKLSNAQIASLTESPGANGLETALTFDYNKLSLTDTPPGGKPESFTTGGVGLKIAPTTSTDLTVPQVPGSSPLEYFLKIDLGNGIKLVPVDGFDFGASSPFSNTGRATGRNQFSPLTVDIHSLTGLTTLFSDAATLKLIKSVDLEAFSLAKDGEAKEAFDLNLSNAVISGLKELTGANGIETELTLNYNKLTLTEPSQNADGSTQTLSFSESGIKMAAQVSSDLGSVPAVQSSPLHYYLKIDGVNGDVTAENFDKWLKVDGFSIGETSPFSASAGQATGRTEFSPLTVDVSSLAGLTTLFSDEATLKLIKSVELVAVKDLNEEGATQTVYDLKLSNAELSSLKESPGANGIETQLTFDYNKLTLTEPSQSADGKTQSSTFSESNIKIAPSASTDFSSVPAVQSSSPLHYFLKIDGVSGDVAQNNFTKWLAVDGFDFGETSPLDVASGRAAGRTQFSPLTVDVHSLAGLATLFTDEATHKLIKSVELVAVRDTGDGAEQTVYDLKLSNDLISSIKETPGANGLETQLVLDYNKLALTTSTQNADGEILPSTFTESGIKIAPATSPDFSSVPQVPSSSPLHYFLKIEGVAGDVTDAAFVKYFAVDGFDFGSTAQLAAAIGRATGGTQFSPLTVDIHSLSGIAALFEDATTHKVITSVDLVAVQDDLKDGGASQTVFDLKLSNAQIASLKETPGTNGLESQLTFNYNKLSLTDVPQSPDGAFDNAETFKHIGGVKFTPSTSNDLAVTDVPSDSPLKYFLKINGVNGDATSEAFLKWFTVDGFDFGEATPTAGAAAGGRTQFSPLTVEIHSLAGLAPLFGDEATHKLISSADLVAVRQSKDGVAQTVFDLKLSNASISGLQDSSGPNGVDTLLTLQFSKEALTEPSLTNPDGSSGNLFDLTNKFA
jgi:type VI protein secretion system component Hcp